MGADSHAGARRGQHRPDVSARVSSIMADSILWDNHGCMPLKPDDSFLPQLARYRAAGFNVVAINIGMADISLIDHMRVLSFMRRWISLHPDDYLLIERATDIARCKAEGRLGIVFDVEGMTPVQDDISFVQTFYELGVRWMLIAYNRNNRAGGGCLDEDTGLTPTGRAIIDEMERVGMVLCLSHAGRRSVMDALDYATAPTIFSHSNPHGVTPHARNVMDDVMKTCAAKGGVIGLNGYETFLGMGGDLVDSLLRQIFYVVDLVGPAHVGLGLDYVFDLSDFEEDIRVNAHIYPPDVANARMIPPEALGAIVEGLARSNLSDEQISGIIGGNWMRIAQAVWK